MECDPSHHMLSMFLEKKRLWRLEMDLGHLHIQGSFGDFLLSLASKFTGAHEIHAKHISFQMEMFWLI